jgi:hypothetical protein
MAKLYQFPRHLLMGVDVQCDCIQATALGGRTGCCPICDGGLSLCTVCGGAEGSMPTDCPGHRMQAEVSDAVYAGEVDYDRRDGWVQRDVRTYKRGAR